ncbi:hypothetical protein Pla175_05850 [Pirellulimonas nuda]|uniref:VanZ-like domain-containing protein n=1 Tax=Pirellulimonas nuda TaxID=2528009 RepID=A0A518D6W1_9BACT|nr:VanZ family protein [Pirellulimonas nuda]QDU87228.1 hypothetical protein Pla175_05850 [Pirellulimonas nuda]
MFLPTNPRFWALLAVGYWLSLLVATHLPADLAPAHAGSWDKVAHTVGFGLLALFCGIAWRLVAGALGLRESAAILLTLSIYAAIDECTQPWFGRNCDPLDWAADMAGASAGLAAAMVLIAVVRRPRRRARPTPTPPTVHSSGEEFAVGAN